jgi:predicted secreted Zn-dependent protease
MNTQGTVVCKITAFACFYNTFTWTYQGTGSGSACKVTKVDFSANYYIILPHWTGPAPAPTALVTWWQTVFNHLVWHESQHLAIARTYVEKYRQAILNGPCNQAEQLKLVKPLTPQLEAEQDAFDVQDGHNWAWPPYNG